MSEQDIELVQMLQEINPEDDFVIAIMSYARSQEDRKAVSDFIKAGDDVDEETVTVLAIQLSQK